ncbi:MAG TPA: isoprenylcysteine carboxylmethyltransferase family protein [Gemmatimonadales bacterium]|nr:isoprenylcysteine carboxylmethyltransferase family protein [Gemmatimonadales bacterium]
MPTVLRHLLAVLLLPVVVAVVAPILLRTAPGDSHWTLDGVPRFLARASGAGLIGIGVALFAWCVALFARVGRGTLAPWDPTRRLVAVGPYRLTRNPMITGVALALAGQALFWGSRRIALWAAGFVLVNHAYFLLLEEPGLRRRFGSEYETYQTGVPRWLPRIRRRS